jgi:hypothetical protein
LTTGKQRLSEPFCFEHPGKEMLLDIQLIQDHYESCPVMSLVWSVETTAAGSQSTVCQTKYCLQPDTLSWIE